MTIGEPVTSAAQRAASRVLKSRHAHLDCQAEVDNDLTRTKWRIKMNAAKKLKPTLKHREAKKTKSDSYVRLKIAQMRRAIRDTNDNQSRLFLTGVLAGLRWTIVDIRQKARRRRPRFRVYLVRPLKSPFS